MVSHIKSDIFVLIKRYSARESRFTWRKTTLHILHNSFRQSQTITLDSSFLFPHIPCPMLFRRFKKNIEIKVDIIVATLKEGKRGQMFGWCYHKDRCNSPSSRLYRQQRTCLENVQSITTISNLFRLLAQQLNCQLEQSQKAWTRKSSSTILCTRLCIYSSTLRLGETCSSVPLPTGKKLNK